MLIKNAKVLTMEGSQEVYEDLAILVEDGRIKAVGRDLEETGAILDAKGAILMPGFIDAHCHLGMWEDALGFEGDDGNEMTNPITPELRAIDAINPMDRNFSEAIKGGVLTVCTGPGSANVMGGTFCVMKTCGHRVDDMLIKEAAAMKIAFGENPKRVYRGKDKTPSTRMATAAELRKVLFEAREYYDGRQLADESKRPKFDLKLESLLPVMEGKMPLKAHAHRADDIFTALRIAREFNLKLTLEHVTEGHLIADDLAAEGVPCIVGPSFGDRSKVELKNKSFVTPGKLAAAGITVAIMTDHPVIPIEHLNMTAAYCVKEGMDHYEALKALTINPARILEVDDRIGSIKAGKDADLVLWNGDPLDISSSVQLAMVNGKVVYEKDIPISAGKQS